MRLFTNPLDPRAHPSYATIAGLRVSAHFLIRRDGALMQFVSCDDRAWHAGASRGKGASAATTFRSAIELEGTDDVPYAPAQYARLAALIRAPAPPLPDDRRGRPQRRRARAARPTPARRSTGSVWRI